MKRIHFYTIALAALLSSRTFSETINLGEGLSVEPASTLPIAFQTVPSFDASKKMLLRKSAERPGDQKLPYFISVNRLPRGWVDSEQYFTRLLRDLSAASEEYSVEVIEEGQYQSHAGVSGRYIEYSFTPLGSGKPQHQIAHFLTNTRRGYVAIGALLDRDAAAQLREDSIAIFQTAAIAMTNAPAPATKQPATSPAQ